MRTRRRTSRAGVTATVAVVVAALLVACSDDEPRASQPAITAPSTTATTASSSTTTTSEPTPERVEATPPPDEPRPDIDVNVTYPSDFTEEQVEVVEAYRGYWHAAYLMNDPCGPTPPGEPARCLPDPDHALIARFADGERLASVKANAASNIDEGEVVVLPSNARYRHDVVVVQVDASLATLRACAVDDAVLLSANTGAVLDDDVVTREYLVTLEDSGDGWKVIGSELTTLHEWNGEEMDQCLSGV